MWACIVSTLTFWVQAAPVSHHGLPVLQGQALSLDAGWVDQSNSGWEAPLLAYESEKKWKSHSCVPTLCNSMDCRLSSSIHEILQARVLEWVTVSFSQGSSQAGDRTQVSCIAGRFFTNWASSSSIKGEVSNFLSTCPLLCFVFVSYSHCRLARGIYWALSNTPAANWHAPGPCERSSKNPLDRPLNSCLLTFSHLHHASKQALTPQLCVPSI